MIKLNRLIPLVTASLLALGLQSHADPAQAEDDAYSMAVYYKARGYDMSPTNSSGMGGAGFTMRLLIPVSKGLDYVILVGADRFALDIDLYVYDEVGSLILDDRRSDRRAGVKFRSSYNGTVAAYVHMARAGSPLAAYAVMVGRRGVAPLADAAPGAPGAGGAGGAPPAAGGAPGGVAPLGDK